MATTFLEVTGLSRAFGETRALVGATLRMRAGEMHSLCGENGSGKTTLIKILSGIIRADSGSVVWDGAERQMATPSAASDAGIATVFQETLVVPELSVVDNIVMGTDKVFRVARSRSEELAVARAALDALGAGGVNPHRPVWSLSLAECQLVTIARAIIRPWKLLVLDEGTSALDRDQRDRLFDYLKRCCTEGKSVLFTSHRIDEVASLADNVTVLRLGATVSATPMAETSARQILASMAGRDVSDELSPQAEAAPRATAQVAKTGEPVLLAEDVALTDRTDGQSLSVHAGEILGLAGLEGHGQLEFTKVLAGLSRPARGSVSVVTPKGERRVVKSFAATRRLGVAYVPRERKHEGLFFTLSIFENFGVALLPDASAGGFIRKSRIRKKYEKYARILRLKAGSPSDLIGMLSGGNQQKVLLARWLATDPRVFILNDPLRGVDGNTKDDLYPLIRQLADEGMAIVLLSTELRELLSLCDRIAVFHRGRIQEIVDARKSTDADIVAAMFAHAEGRHDTETT